jgi:anthranilate synthase/aminodeoxychorismate synthase-like glutamine amidotransferase
MILMLDNYDSFTYNVVQYLSELGADLTVYRNDAITVNEVSKLRPSGIVLSPGPGRPENAGVMLDIICKFAGKTPILGICLGHQGIGQAFGATIGYAPTLMHGKTSDILHDSSALFLNVSSPFVATRYHSLVIEPGTLPKEFTVTAWTADKVIMAIQHKSMALYGVQFHPESIMTTEGKKILSNFLETLP